MPQKHILPSVDQHSMCLTKLVDTTNHEIRDKSTVLQSNVNNKHNKFISFQTQSVSRNTAVPLLVKNSVLFSRVHPPSPSFTFLSGTYVQYKHTFYSREANPSPSQSGRPRHVHHPQLRRPPPNPPKTKQIISPRLPSSWPRASPRAPSVPPSTGRYPRPLLAVRHGAP